MQSCNSDTALTNRSGPTVVIHDSHDSGTVVTGTNFKRWLATMSCSCATFAHSTLSPFRIVLRVRRDATSGDRRPTSRLIGAVDYGFQQQQYCFSQLGTTLTMSSTAFSTNLKISIITYGNAHTISHCLWMLMLL